MSSKRGIIPEWNINHHIMGLDIFMPITPIRSKAPCAKKQNRNKQQKACKK
jgi:hypothetical protein